MNSWISESTFGPVGNRQRSAYVSVSLLKLFSIFADGDHFHKEVLICTPFKLIAIKEKQMRCG